jgi:hypothetical protein
MIKAPEHNIRNEAARTLVEAMAQFSPLTAAAARIFQFTRQTQYEKEKEAWTSEITKLINDHEDTLKIFYDYLFPKISISQDALALAKILIDTSEQGLEDFIELDVVKNLFPEISEEELDASIAELQHYGFVDSDPEVIIRKPSLYIAL